MPITRSAKKKMRSSAAARTVNKMRKGKIKAFEQAFKRCAESGDLEKMSAAFKDAQSYIAKGVKWGAIHINRASARTARMHAILRAAS
jgi:ribosomal protein S20